MPEESYYSGIRDRVLIRLDTLIRLRWYAIIGQVGAVLIIVFGFQYTMPWKVCLALIAASAALNVWLAQRYKASHRLPAEAAFSLLAFDIFQLGLLLLLTGGLQNPFAILILAPVVVSSTSLGHWHILMLGALAIAVITFLAFFHLPLPWDPAFPLKIPFLFIIGVWVAIVCTLAFTAIYVFRVAEEARKLADALSATELVLQREQHLSTLDGLAAAAAHELGTPLATIAVVSKEMLHALPDDSDMRDDAALLRDQAQRCRDILQKLTSLSIEGEGILAKQSLTAVVEEEVEPLRNFGIDITVHSQGDPANVPMINRNPGMHYGLGNMIDNAVDFAKESVVVIMRWDEERMHVEISDDGPGFPSALLDKLGEPFVTARKQAKGARKRGMGLGLFIAKTLLERSGAEVTFSNNTKQKQHCQGAFVEVSWSRQRLEQDQDEAV